MPITITTGLSKKVGLPDYGSLGASCQVAFEVGHDLLERDLAGFHEKVKNAFIACRQAVHDELAREQDAGVSSNGHTNGHTNGNTASNGKVRSNGRKATASQVRALHAIANRQGLDLAQTLQDRYGTAEPEDLSITEASELIDSLKTVSNGAGGRR